jgi:peptide/nickel transport system permease protein
MLWTRFRRHRAGVIAVVLLAISLFLACFGPRLAPFDPRHMSWDTLQSPGRNHPFGTDNLGRDVLSQVMHGIRSAMVVGLTAALVSTALGITIGALAGSAGGSLDSLLMRFTDGFMVIPSFFVLLLVASIYGSSLLLIAIMIGLTTWPTTARVVRMQFLALREREFVTAARALGAGNARVVLRHLLPNALPSVIVMAALRGSGAILQEASLSFLGLGDPNIISLGQMLMNALQYMQLAWWPAVFPGFCIFVLVLAFNLFSDAMNDALNPRFARRL